MSKWVCMKCYRAHKWCGKYHANIAESISYGLPCDDCNAEAGEQCRPYCTGKAAHDQDSGKQST